MFPQTADRPVDCPRGLRTHNSHAHVLPGDATTTRRDCNTTSGSKTPVGIYCERSNVSCITITTSSNSSGSKLSATDTSSLDADHIGHDFEIVTVYVNRQYVTALR